MARPIVRSANKTKVMISGEWQKVMQKAARWSRGVCGRGVGSKSIQYTSCQKWVHKKCSGIKGSMSKVIVIYLHLGCLNPVTVDRSRWMKLIKDD